MSNAAFCSMATSVSHHASGRLVLCQIFAQRFSPHRPFGYVSFGISPAKIRIAPLGSQFTSVLVRQPIVVCIGASVPFLSTGLGLGVRSRRRTVFVLPSFPVSSKILFFLHLSLRRLFVFLFHVAQGGRMKC